MRKILNGTLIGTGALFVLSLFSYSPLLLTICLTLFVAAVVVNCCHLWKGRSPLRQMAEATEDRANKEFKNKQYGKAYINMIASPMVIIGIAMVALCMFYMWSTVLK